MFELEFETGKEKFIKNLMSFVKFQRFYLRVFATVVNKESMTGVIDWIGNIIIPAQCTSIEYELIYDEEAVWMEDDIDFFCYEEDGFVKAIEKKW